MEASTQKHREWIHAIAGDYHSTVRTADYQLPSADYEQASKDYAEVCRLEPLNPRPFIGLGVLALRVNDFENAQTAFETACRLDPASPKALCGLAAAHHLQARPQMAAAMYRRCLELDEDNLTALLGLLEIANDTKQFDTLPPLLRQYISRHPDDVAVRLCLAAAYLNQNLPAPAHKVLLEILTINHQNAAASAIIEEFENIRLNTQTHHAKSI